MQNDEEKPRNGYDSTVTFDGDRVTVTTGSISTVFRRGEEPVTAASAARQIALLHSIIRGFEPLSRP